jgi:hypothetical protein
MDADDAAAARAAKRKARILAGGESRLKLVLGEVAALPGGDDVGPVTAPARMHVAPAAATPAPPLPVSPDSTPSASPPPAGGVVTRLCSPVAGRPS